MYAVVVLVVVMVLCAAAGHPRAEPQEPFQAELQEASLRRTLVYHATPVDAILQRADEADEQLDALVARRPTFKLVQADAQFIYTDALRHWLTPRGTRPPLVTMMKSPRQLFFFQKSDGRAVTVQDMPAGTRIAYVHPEEAVLGRRTLEACEGVAAVAWMEAVKSYAAAAAALSSGRCDVVCALINKESPAWGALLGITYENIKMASLAATVPFARREMRTIATNSRNPEIPLPPRTATSNVVCIDTCLAIADGARPGEKALQDILFATNQPTRNNEFTRYFMFVEEAMADMREYNAGLDEGFVDGGRMSVLDFRGEIPLESRRVLGEPSAFEYTSPTHVAGWGVNMRAGDRLYDEASKTYLYVVAPGKMHTAIPVGSGLFEPHRGDVYYDGERRVHGRIVDGKLVWDERPAAWDATVDDPRFRCTAEPTVKNRFICPGNSWDRPCEQSEECPFYVGGGGGGGGGGGCKDGYCEMPLGVERVGFRKHKGVAKAQCQGCGSDVSAVACCAKQDSPAYAFLSGHSKDVVYSESPVQATGRSVAPSAPLIDRLRAYSEPVAAQAVTAAQSVQAVAVAQAAKAVPMIDRLRGAVYRISTMYIK